MLELRATGPVLCEAGVVRSRQAASLEKRLAEIHAGVREVIASFQPQVMAVEELYSHYERPRTAILMGHARGVICLAAAEAGIPVRHYAATQVKSMLTGSGRATKGKFSWRSAASSPCRTSRSSRRGRRDGDRSVPCISQKRTR